MPLQELPAETIAQIIGELKDDRKSQLQASALNRIWLAQGRRSLFLELDAKLSIKNEDDVIAFERILSSPAPTFPVPFTCEHLSLEGLTTITNEGALAIQKLESYIHVSHSLTLAFREGAIPLPIAGALKEWGRHISQAAILGGKHEPHTFFDTLSLLPKLESLELQDVEFATVIVPQGPMAQLAFPSTLTTLSIIGGASPFRLFESQVLPGGGFRNITTLTVQTRFRSGNVGLTEMLRCLPRLSTVGTVKLQPIYDLRYGDLERDTQNIFICPFPPILEIRGPKRLEIDFSAFPSQWALDFLSMCALYLPYRRGEGIIVDIRVPRSLDLWDDQGPVTQLEQLLQFAVYDDLSARGPPKSSIIVRDFPAFLPGRIGTSIVVCRCPVVFVDAGA